MNEYVAEYTAKDGTKYSVKGTINECANWADNILRTHGEGAVLVTKEDKDGVHHKTEH